MHNRMKTSAQFDSFTWRR